MKKAGVKVVQGDEWQMEGDLVLKEGKIYVSQMSYSLVVILELSGVSEIQYKEIIIIGDE